MRSLIAIVLTLLSPLLADGLAIGEQASKMPRIGLLTGGRVPGSQPNRHALLQGLEELGYVQGKNIIVEYRTYRGKRSLIPEMAAELVRLKVDVLVPSGPSALRAFMKLTKTIPIVTPNGSSDPVKAGYVKSLSRPGGNVTGLSIGAKGLQSKRMELLKETFPSINRVVFLNPLRGRETLEEYERVARHLNMELKVVNVQRDSDFEQAFTAITGFVPDALLIDHNGLTHRRFDRIGEFVMKNRLPTMNSERRFVEVGGLMSYGVDSRANWWRAAYFVDKILRGANPATLPVEPPRLEFVINLKTAKALGITIPPEILLEADAIIK